METYHLVKINRNHLKFNINNKKQNYYEKNLLYDYAVNAMLH